MRELARIRKIIMSHKAILFRRILFRLCCKGQYTSGKEEQKEVRRRRHELEEATKITKTFQSGNVSPIHTITTKQQRQETRRVRSILTSVASPHVLGQ